LNPVRLKADTTDDNIAADLSIGSVRLQPDQPPLGSPDHFPSLDLAVHGIRHVSDLNHLGHVHRMVACAAHVNVR
jgi:hypothetical protein